VETERDEADARVSARLTALEEETATLRSALAESRSREDLLQARTEELGRRWNALRKLLSEDGPTGG
jgi:hypothetical protein